MSTVNPNNPPPQGYGISLFQWIVENIFFIKRRLNGISGGGGSSINLETNNVSNPVQDTLNLIDGINTTVVDNGDGSVQIDATGGASGPTIYTANGTIVAGGSRDIDCDGNSLNFNNAIVFQAGLNDGGATHISIGNDGAPYAELTVSDNFIVQALLNEQTTQVGFDATNVVFDNVAETATFSTVARSKRGFRATDNDGNVTAGIDNQHVYIYNSTGDAGIDMNVNTSGFSVKQTWSNVNWSATIQLSNGGNTLNFVPPSYPDNASAVLSGLSVGDWYTNTFTGAITPVQDPYTPTYGGGISGGLSGGSVTVVADGITPTSVIQITAITPVGGITLTNFSYTPGTGSFDIVDAGGAGVNDGLTFSWAFFNF